MSGTALGHLLELSALREEGICSEFVSRRRGHLGLGLASFGTKNPPNLATKGRAGRLQGKIRKLRSATSPQPVCAHAHAHRCTRTRARAQAHRFPPLFLGQVAAGFRGQRPRGGGWPWKFERKKPEVQEVR